MSAPGWTHKKSQGGNGQCMAGFTGVQNVQRSDNRLGAFWVQKGAIFRHFPPFSETQEKRVSGI